MRLDETRDDANLSLSHVAIDERRRAIAHGPELHKRLFIFRLVVNHAVFRDDLRREHLFHLGARVRAMCPELIDQSDLLAGNVFQILKQPGN